MSVDVNSKEQVVRSNCRGCHGSCGVLVYVKDNTIVKIEGDPDFPTNHGTLCSKGLAFKQLVYHPDRLKHPLKRAGKKGQGKLVAADQEMYHDPAHPSAVVLPVLR